MINIVNKVDCCGCEACYNACPNESIRMKSDEEGFLYPQVNQDTCVNCGLCEKVCPISNCETKKNENQVAYTEKQLYAYSVRGGSMITTPWSKKKSDSYVEITNEAISYFDERKEYKLAQAAIYWQIQFGIEAFERMLMNPKATQDDYNEVMTCVRAGYKRLKLSSLGFGLKKYLKKKLEFFLFTTNPRLLCKLKKKELR